MEKIAVHCPTPEDWDKVKDTCETNSRFDWWDSYKEDSVIYPYDKPAMFGSKSHAKGKGYTIIPASEYLGGTMEKLAKLCCNKKCDSYNVSEQNNCEYWSDLKKCAYHGGCESWEENEVKMTKLIDKENNMKENNINKNVLEVFGDLPAKEVVIIDSHFTDEMLKVIMMKKFHKEIKAACMEAEEKLKEEE